MEGKCPAGHTFNQKICETCDNLCKSVIKSISNNPRVNLESVGYVGHNLAFHFKCPKSHVWLVQNITCDNPTIQCPHCFPIPTELPPPPSFHDTIFSMRFPHSQNGSFVFHQHATTQQRFTIHFGTISPPQPPPIRVWEILPNYFRDENAAPYTLEDRQAAIDMILQNSQHPAYCLCLRKEDVTKKEIVTKHFRRMALLVHPDKAQIKGSNEAFVLVNSSYKALQNR